MACLHYFSLLFYFLFLLMHSLCLLSPAAQFSYFNFIASLALGKNTTTGLVAIFQPPHTAGYQTTQKTYYQTVNDCSFYSTFSQTNTKKKIKPKTIVFLLTICLRMINIPLCHMNSATRNKGLQWKTGNTFFSRSPCVKTKKLIVLGPPGVRHEQQKKIAYRPHSSFFFLV